MLSLAYLLAAAIVQAPPPRVVPMQPSGPVVTTATGLRIQTLSPGTGDRPRPDDAVLITYVGPLADGTVFDKSEQPVGMMVSGVVPGFSEALQLMNKGGTYLIWLPPQLAYGEKGAGGVIPPNATLEFTVTLVDIGRPAAAPEPAAPRR